MTPMGAGGRGGRGGAFVLFVGTESCGMTPDKIQGLILLTCWRSFA